VQAAGAPGRSTAVGQGRPHRVRRPRRQRRSDAGPALGPFSASMAWVGSLGARLGGGARPDTGADGPASTAELDVLSLSLHDDDDEHDDGEAALMGSNVSAAVDSTSITSEDSGDQAAGWEAEEATAGMGTPVQVPVQRGAAAAGEDEEEEDETSDEDGDSESDDDDDDDVPSQHLDSAPLLERIVLGAADAGESAAVASAMLFAAGARTAWRGLRWGLARGAGAAGRGVGAALSARHSWRGFASGFSKVPQSDGDIELPRVRDPKSDGDDDGQGKTTPPDADDAVSVPIPHAWRQRVKRCPPLIVAGGALLAVAALSSLFGVGITEQHADRSARDNAAGRFHALLHPPSSSTHPHPSVSPSPLASTVPPAPPPPPPPSPAVIWRQALCAPVNVTTPSQLPRPSGQPATAPVPPLLGTPHLAPHVLANATLANASRLFREMTRAGVREGGRGCVCVSVCV